MHDKTAVAPVKRKSFLAKKRTLRDAGFYAAIVCIPVIQFCIFYIGVNFNSVIMSFQSYDPISQQFRWTGFANYVDFFRSFVKDYVWVHCLKNSTLAFLVSVLITSTLSIVFAYYIYKKYFGYKVFRIILFIPSIVSSLVTVAVFVRFVDGALPQTLSNLLGTNVRGLLANPDSQFATILFYNVWVAFGSTLLIYSSAMNGISPAITEAAQMDGASPFREFISIVFPMIWPTYVVFFTTALAGYFSNSLNIYAFYGSWADDRLYTFGYYLFRNAEVNKLTMTGYPALSAMGICFTVILAPIVFGVRKLMYKFGPSAD